MHRQGRRFVQHQQLGILVEHFEIGRNGGLDRVGNHHAHDVTGHQYLLQTSRLVVDGEQPSVAVLCHEGRIVGVGPHPRQQLGEGQACAVLADEDGTMVVVRRPGCVAASA